MRIADSTYGSDSSGSMTRRRSICCAIGDGLVDHGALALRELERRAHRLERQQDVREEDRRVDPEAQRLQRDLHGQLRRLAELEQRARLAQLAVLGHVAPGLPHEPHGRSLDGLAPAGAQEEVVHEGKTSSAGPQPPLQLFWL